MRTINTFGLTNRSMLLPYSLLALILITGIIYSVAAHKLTIIAALTGAVIACFVFAGAGYTGVAMMTAFFISGSMATSWQLRKKQDFIKPEEHKSGRTAGQVIANSGVAALTGILALIFPRHTHLWILMMAAGFASAIADTLSSELGTIYGKRFFNITTLKPDQRGLDGVVSLEGMLFGIAGCVIMAIVYAVGFGWSMWLISIIIAGTAGNVADSILGAALERRGHITNNTMNFLNTLIAALVMLLIYFMAKKP